MMIVIILIIVLRCAVSVNGHTAVAAVYTRKYTRIEELN
jgi:hypothetical protein